MTSPLLHVVLHRPLIPNNTGNIGRTCVATGCALHLIHPLGFSTDVKACRRAGLDYWPRLAPAEHGSWEEYRRREGSARLWLFSTRGRRPPWEAGFEPGDHLVFGNEDSGLPDEILGAHPDNILTFPMLTGERSLNLATAVCAAVYEAVRQFQGAGVVRIGPDGRLERFPPGSPTGGGDST